MAIELDPRLELCYKLAEKERDTYPPHLRKSLDEIFLNLILMCEKTKDLTIEDLKPTVSRYR
jgi:hypothetical protein